MMNIFKRSRSKILSAVAIIVVLLFNSCSKESGGERSKMDQYTAAYNKWKMMKVTNYSFSLSLNCFCAGSWPYDTEVKNDLLMKVTDRNGAVYTMYSSTLPPNGSKTIEGLFEFIKTSLERNPYRAEITYNAQYGYPESIYFDYSAQTADEEMGYTVANFKTRL